MGGHGGRQSSTWASRCKGHAWSTLRTLLDWASGAQRRTEAFTCCWLTAARMQGDALCVYMSWHDAAVTAHPHTRNTVSLVEDTCTCLLYTSDAADE